MPHPTKEPAWFSDLVLGSFVIECYKGKHTAIRTFQFGKVGFGFGGFDFGIWNLRYFWFRTRGSG